MNGLSAIPCLAVLVVWPFPSVGLAGEILDTPPLEAKTMTEVLAEHSRKFINRQNEEVFSLAKGLDPGKWFHVDLKTHCNVNMWSSAGQTIPPQFHQMETGRRTFYGVPFQIIAPGENADKTAVALPSTRLLTNSLPDTVEVPVGRKAAVLYFLHATYYTTTEGKQFYTVTYEDGSENRTRFVGTKHSGDWYHQNTRIYTEDVRYVLVPTTRSSTLHHRNLHIFQWKNPAPDKAIKSVTFQSDRKAEMAIIVVAVTGHPDAAAQ
jgi:hypothetical protein